MSQQQLPDRYCPACGRELADAERTINKKRCPEHGTLAITTTVIDG